MQSGSIEIECWGIQSAQFHSNEIAILREDKPDNKRFNK